MVNKTNVLAVAAAIEHAADGMIDNKVGFNMLGYSLHYSAELDHTGHGCGTVACIAGWAVVVQDDALTDEFKSRRSLQGDIPNRAQVFLGLDKPQADHLFCPPNLMWTTITPRQAVATLRHLAETEEVKWDE